MAKNCEERQVEDLLSRHCPSTNCGSRKRQSLKLSSGGWSSVVSRPGQLPDIALLPECPITLTTYCKHSRTTMFWNIATIHYRHHPHFGATVTMVRKCSHLGPHQYRWRFPNGVQNVDSGVECWMKISAVDGDRRVPDLSITALLLLRDLIDAQRGIPEPSGTIASEASSPGVHLMSPCPPGSSSLEIRETQDCRRQRDTVAQLLTHLLLQR